MCTRKDYIEVLKYIVFGITAVGWKRNLLANTGLISLIALGKAILWTTTNVPCLLSPDVTTTANGIEGSAVSWVP